MPTAETQPAGTTTLSSSEIVLLQAGYALSDSTQLTLSATPPIEGALPLDLTLKSTVARGDAYRLAFFGGVSGISGLPNGPFWIGRAGFVGQGCLDVNCRSSVNLGAMALLAGPATFVGTGLGAVLRVSELFALLFEVDTLVPSGRAVAEIHGVSLGSGFRWSGRRWAVDAALFASLEGNVATVPYVVASYRFLDD
jgi:hypothetical protein